MYNFIFKMPSVSMDQALELLEQIRQNFSTQIEIFEFEWLEHSFYISMRATNDMMKQMLAMFPQLEKFDQWSLKVGE